MKRVVITGATGAVGTALVAELIRHQVEVLVICREGSARNNQIPESPLVQKVYCSLDQLKTLNNDAGKKYDVFYHFAWAGTTGPARNDMYLQNKNVEYALDAVETAKRFGCDVFVGAGSQAEYGRVEGFLRPDTPAHPEMGYGIGKLCAGQMTREWAHQLGMKHIWVRILSVYGPNDGNQSMVMSTIHKLKKGEVPRFTKGEQVWDYLYSKDAARAFYAVGTRGIDGRVYVLGSGQGRPLVEYIEEIRKSVDQQGKVDLGAIPYGEKQVMFLQADISLLQDEIEFEPIYTFQDGITETIKWVEEHN